MHRTARLTAVATLLGAGMLAAGVPAASAASPTSHCSASALRVTVRGGGAGVSHRGYLLVFTNISRSACTVTGYPHVLIDNAARKAVRGASRTPSGYLGGLAAGHTPAKVSLAPGRATSAMLEGLAIEPDGDGCPTRPLLSVTAPQTFRPKLVRVATEICTDVEVHPVVAR